MLNNSINKFVRFKQLQNQLLTRENKINQDIALSMVKEMSNLDLDINQLLDAVDILSVIIGLNSANRCMIKNAFEDGFINEKQYNLLKMLLIDSRWKDYEV